MNEQGEHIEIRTKNESGVIHMHKWIELYTIASKLVDNSPCR